MAYCDSWNQFYSVITWIDRKRLWLVWSKSDFCMLIGSAVTFCRWSGQIYSQLVSSFLRSPCTKKYWNRFIFDRVIPNIKRVTFGARCSNSLPSHTSDSVFDKQRISNNKCIVLCCKWCQVCTHKIFGQSPSMQYVKTTYTYHYKCQKYW